MARERRRGRSAAQFVAVSGVVAADPADEGFLPVGRGPVGRSAGPGLEFRMERVEIPPRALAPQEFDGLVGEKPAGGGIRKPGDRAADQAAGIDQLFIRRYRPHGLSCHRLRHSTLRFGGKKFPRGNFCNRARPGRCPALPCPVGRRAGCDAIWWAGAVLAAHP